MTSPTSESAIDPDLAALLGSAGVPAPYAVRAADRLGERAAALLRADPWRLLRVPGVRPEQADHFAGRVLAQQGEQARAEDVRRGRALVVHVLTEAARRGHTAMTPRAVVSALGALGVPDPSRAIEAALEEAEVVTLLEEAEFDPLAEEDEPPEPQESLGLSRYALAEEAAAEGLQRLSATAEPLLPDETVRALRADLPEDRALALTAAARTGVSVLHGAPEEVEQTAVAIARALASCDVPVALAACTATGARSLGEGAVGLYELLEAARPPGAPAGVVGFGRGEQRPLEVAAVVVPDAGALDVEAAAALVEACGDGTHLVLGGDPAALPPSGPGRVLADLAASETVPVIELEAAAHGQPAGFLAAVRRGELPAVRPPGREVVIVPARAEEEAVHRAVQIVTDSIPRALRIAPQDVQVVTPLAGGRAGAAALNAALKAHLNPGPGVCGGFDPGDRVIAAAPVAGVAAGEHGTVTAASPSGLRVAFGTGREPVEVPATALPRLRHGWAAPVALARAARYPAVVAVIPQEAASALSRPLAVTAFGLARRHLSVVHTAGPALARAVRENLGSPRETRLPRLMRQ